MGTTIFTSCSFPWKYHHQQMVPSSHLLGHSSQETGVSRIRATIEPREFEKPIGLLKRRSALVSGISLASSTILGFPGDGLAAVKQGLLAGRIPGLSEPDEQGWRTYRRPDDKSGGHGVGWSPIIPYAFKVPQEWEEVPVSIADLGGTEIDLRFSSSKEGRLFVIVAPVLRFADDLGDNATIERIGPPEKVINAFGPEVIGENVEGKVLSMNVAEHSGRMYYQFELEPPHVLITATAAGNRLYLFSVTGNGLQWKRHYKDLKRIAESFRVV
ncbi:psbP domain-containing protein 4, chloroplastic isoform X2 [Ricinus communis]|uniref:Thylakoid lumenal 29.8 kDa protein, chloroplast, putative n=1 Tax=Ricinus communis TaxID=3988 RepID=B9SJK7_RICCO|nr:psbP domain-containing protein 4, chloroplastic isoform X2 [Ricinus communis]EEF36252.1 Thylakoid lumenal 29.8 kDa protein, chloroplast precursor, putative [Ricinus communis]|eukprot:XP_002526176.1 psbP domain-containing protein 4, chloroplastic isoform X2 [Ricinus communis]